MQNSLSLSAPSAEFFLRLSGVIKPVAQSARSRKPLQSSDTKVKVCLEVGLWMLPAGPDVSVGDNLVILSNVLASYEASFLINV
ncbi:unnamed protein product [Camellia sinensis]